MTAARRPPKVPRPAPLMTAESPMMAALAVDPARVDDFWAELRTPLVEDVGVPGRLLVTFCWRDAEAEQVLLFANRITDETRLDETLLARVPSTDVWHVGFLLEPDWRASYSFLVQRAGEAAPWVAEGGQVALRAALDRGLPDPRNPITGPDRSGVARSIVALPEAPVQPWLEARPGVPIGPVTRVAAPDGREAWLYESADATDGAVLPVLLVLDGEVWVGPQDLPTTLDNLVADGVVGPVRALFWSSGGHDARWSELGDEAGHSVDHVVDVLLPWLGERWPRPDASGVAVIGQSLGGLTALRVALRRPDVVGVAISQSASLWLDDLVDDVTALPETPVPWVHLSHGRHEWVLAGPHKELAMALADAGVPVVARDYNGGHDYAWWRGAVADALAEVPGLRAQSQVQPTP